MYRTTAEAQRAAIARAIAAQCAAGRHTTGCSHRPAPEWVLRALGLVPEALPVKVAYRA